jgi:signal transduction histidine kinase
VLQSAFTRGAMGIPETAALKGTVADRQRWLGVYEGLATANGAADVRNQIVGEDAQQVDTYERQGIAAVDNPTLRLDGDPAVWENAMRGTLTGLNSSSLQQIAAIDGQAVSIHNAAVDSLRRFLFLAGAAIALSIGLGLLLARAVTQPLGRLTAAAKKLAEVQLPGLVNGLRSPSAEDQQYLVATIQPIDIRSKDEIGQQAEAFNSVQTTAVDVAAEQAELLRKGISEIFVNLARRNQVLIDRQIEFLDELEAAEDDPDQLGQLYRLDHLATRMRRNAESLLVLAGLEPTRKRTRPVALVDVVRAAIGEVEDYARVDIAGFDEVEVVGNAAVDLGHLLAELLENATNFSPPASRVHVDGHGAANGYVVTINDEGIGMTDEQLAEANSVLASPSPVGLELTRSLGFTVIGRLAARFGVAVRLTASPAGGVAASVHLPSHLMAADDIEDEPVDQVSHIDELPPVTPPELRLVSAEPDDVDDEDLEAAWEAEWPDDLEPEPEPEPELEPVLEEPRVEEPQELPAQKAPIPTFVHAVPQGARFEQGLADLLRGDEVLGAPVLIEPPVETHPVEEGPPTEARPFEPVPVADLPPVTKSGLARRVPKRANLDQDPVRPGVESPRPAIVPGRRSPDDVRAMLARYRTGLQRGRAPETSTTDDEGMA